MDNNDFFNNNDDDQLKDDIFEEDTKQPDEDQGQQNTQQTDQSQQRQNNSWNQNHVNPDQWQAYRQHQQYYDQYRQQQQWNQGNPYQNNNYNGYYQPDDSRGFGIASMVLGIISLLCFCSFLNLAPAILAIIFGVISLSRRRSNAFAIAGIVCAAISLVLLVVTVVLFVGNSDLVNAFRDFGNNYGANGFNYYFR